MKYLKIGAGVVVALIVAVVVVLMALPKSYQVERSVVINAPQDVVFAQVHDLRNNEAWSPWKAADDTMVWTYGERTAGVGGTYSWTSDNSGSGTMTIALSEPPSRIENDVEFDGMGASRGYWTFEAVEGGTEVTWGFKGQNSGLTGGLFAMMMDRLVGPQFEDGLARLTVVAEAEAAKPAVLEPAMDEEPADDSDPVATDEADPAADGEPADGG